MRQTGPIQTISDQVYSILRRKICEGEYAPGSWLQEVDLCDQLGVSRSPVREALRRLVSDGLVINIPNKGTFVKEFTCKDIDEIFDMRVLLEGYAILRSHQNLTSQRIETLLAILREMEITYDAGIHPRRRGTPPGDRGPGQQQHRQLDLRPGGVHEPAVPGAFALGAQTL